MKVSTALLLTFILSGCGRLVTGEDVVRFQTLCKPHGGINYVKATNDGADIAYCRENGIIVQGED